MDDRYEREYHLIEEKNWWFLGRRHMIRKLLEKEDAKKKHKILDVGCSGGALIKELKDNGLTVTGCDISQKAIKLCKKKGLKDVVCCDCTKLPFKNNYFDYVIASDVLEHIKDDLGTVKEWVRVLKKKGKIIIFVPAFMSLWSGHDEVNHHFRRYSKKRLIRAIIESGLDIRQVSYWNFLLFFPVSVIRFTKRIIRGKDHVRKIKKTDNKGDLKRLNPVINKILEISLKIENKIINTGVHFPVGISIFVVAQKR